MKTKNMYDPATMTQAVLSQAMELYCLGIELETERLTLAECADELGLSDPRTVEQSAKVQGLCLRFSPLEKEHIAHTEHIMGLTGKCIQ